MKQVALALAALGVAGIAQAADIAPADLSFEDGAIPVSLTGTPGDPARGREVVLDRGTANCIACHSAADYADAPWHGDIGPTLDGVGDRWSEAELRGIVANAKMMFDGTMMPSFYKTSGFIRPGDGFTGKAAPAELAPMLTAQQVEDVVAYLVTLKE